MFLYQKNTIANLVLKNLQTGPMVILNLIEKIKKQRPGTTKQGVYAALRLLNQEEMVVVHQRSASLNMTWITNMSHYLSLAEHYYFQPGLALGHFTNLKDGEKIKYFFKNPILTDTFWIHTLLILLEITAPGEPLFLYNPHCWFFMAHPDHEKTLVRLANAKKHLYLMTIGGKTYLDQITAHELDNTPNQYYMLNKPLFPKNNYYLNIIDNFIIEVWIDPIVANQIEKFYHSVKALTKDHIKTLKSIVETRGKNKLVISCHKARADNLKKKLSKVFYLPKNKSGVTKINLFT
jgi:hypothetical protein